jgi:uncharacterized protein YbdZ (MbtH family)
MSAWKARTTVPEPWECPHEHRSRTAAEVCLRKHLRMKVIRYVTPESLRGETDAKPSNARAS